MAAAWSCAIALAGGASVELAFPIGQAVSGTAAE